MSDNHQGRTARFSTPATDIDRVQSLKHRHQMSSVPYGRDESKPVSASDLSAGLRNLGMELGEGQVQRLQRLSGSDVLKSLVDLGKHVDTESKGGAGRKGAGRKGGGKKGGAPGGGAGGGESKRSSSAKSETSTPGASGAARKTKGESASGQRAGAGIQYGHTSPQPRRAARANVKNLKNNSYGVVESFESQKKAFAKDIQDAGKAKKERGGAARQRGGSGAGGKGGSKGRLGLVWQKVRRGVACGGLD